MNDDIQREIRREWQTLGDQWREQPVPGIDVAALRAQARQRGRGLRRYLTIEVALSLLVLALLAWQYRHDAPSPALAAVYAGLAAGVVVFQSWSLWIRRRQLRDDGLDVGALLQLEIARAQTTIRYWRWGTWACLGLCLLVGAGIWLALPTLPMPDGTRGSRALLGGLLGGCAGVLVSALLGWRIGRRSRQRLARLHALREELGDA